MADKTPDNQIQQTPLTSNLLLLEKILIIKPNHDFFNLINHFNFVFAFKTLCTNNDIHFIGMTLNLTTNLQNP